MRTPPLHRLTRLVAWLCFACCPPAVWADQPNMQTTEQGGVAVSLRFDNLADGAALAEIRLSDAASGRALSGAQPAAWMLARRSEAVASERSCEDKAAALVSGSLGARADIDLNGYRLLTLNQDNTLAFINPHVGLQNSKLESIVQLPATGHDIVAAPRSKRLFVSLRDAGSVAVVDLSERRLLRTVNTGTESLPTRLALDPDGQRVWVGLDGSEQVLALDASTGAELGRVQVGQGLHTLALAPGLPWLFVTNSASNSVTLIDKNRMQAVAQVTVGPTPVAARWSESAQRLAVLSINAGELALIDPKAQTVTARVALERGAVEIGLFDGGRHALVLNGRTGSLDLLDLATPRVVGQMQVGGQPDQLAFSREYAYVRSQQSANVQVVNLAQARQGKLQSVVVPMGRSTPADAPEAMNVASVFGPAPEGNGVLQANPGDGRIYRYAEGMMVPVGSFSNYRRQARALLVLDTSLVERSPGRFETSVRIERGGRYDLVVRNLRPSVTACFVVEASGTPHKEMLVLVPKVALLSVAPKGPKTAVVEFSLSGPAGRPLDADDVLLLAVQWRGSTQIRVRAQRLSPGRYTAKLQGLPPAAFDLMVHAPALELPFDQGRLGRMQWPADGMGSVDGPAAPRVTPPGKDKVM